MLDPVWQSGASNKLIADRADLCRQVRNFFHSKGVLEVFTPILGASSVTELQIGSLSVQESERLLYLQTSPEYYMKRLLASGSGAIYQIASAFRQGETGKLHNVEFTLLEWYRPGFEMVELMDEVEALILCLASLGKFERTSYKELFEHRFNKNPHDLGARALLDLCCESVPTDLKHLESPIESRTRENCLDLLFTAEIQPGLIKPTFVTNYPASQAALAETGEVEGDVVALRFELFCQGIELANGYFELTDADVLESRMERDNQDRAILGLPLVPADQKLLQAMRSGLPECSGVALGLDRVLMLITQSENLDQVITFTSERL